ncbi:MAG: nucleotidyl transferase AbiEii/AbiGii toxin family protein [Proteobacteria bacterium]|nr:nucleotidyl transferase AbiEii/AbiGii toxin family protein [Pseudomonadota bacterium]
MFDKTLARIGASLQKAEIPYMIIGGQAVLLYGEPRLTRDIDITIGINTDRLETLLAIVLDLSLKPLPEDISAFVRQTMVLPALDESTGIRVDFIFSFSPYESQAIQRANKIQILNQDVCFTSIEDLIIHKIFAGRPRDIEDVRMVILKNPDVDISYIEKWLKTFDASSDEKNFLASFRNISF